MNRYLEFSEHERPWQEMRLVRQTNLANETILHYLGRNFGCKPELYELLEWTLKRKPFPRPRCNFEQKDYAGKTALYYFVNYYSPGYHVYEGHSLKALKMLQEAGVDFKCLREEKELLNSIRYDEYQKALYEFLLKPIEGK